LAQATPTPAVSQPLGAAPSQSPKASSQVTTPQSPAVQAAVALASAHTLPSARAGLEQSPVRVSQTPAS